MIANDFGTLVDEHPRFTRVFVNGGAAEKNFVRLVRVDHPVVAGRLPSTSPANTVRYVRKLSTWREAITSRQ
jgi:G:T/U-mismatch repair DNA glycosylase